MLAYQAIGLRYFLVEFDEKKSFEGVLEDIMSGRMDYSFTPEAEAPRKTRFELCAEMRSRIEGLRTIIN